MLNRLMILTAALAFTGCAVDNEIERLPDAEGEVDRGPDGGPVCTEGVTESCEIPGGCVGTRVCVDGAFAPCAAPAEICDGQDNDCDGTVDEGFPGLGAACEAGVGQCAAAGVGICDGAGAAVICDATPGAPAAETCDGTDEDCDGTVDEETDAGQPCETGELGACAAGRTACTDEGAIVCRVETPASDEVCDGLDNDCDGSSDEGEGDAPLERDCYGGPEGTAGVGPCTAGRQTCRDGVFDACVGEVLPAVEICDRADNDCNGEADDISEGSCACLPGEERLCYSGAEGTEDIGACRGGTQTCVADGSTFGPCINEVIPVAEACAGRAEDRDCDGDTDDAEGTGEACAVGVGACRVEGITACGADDVVACDAVPGEPGIEICNGMDDDCDGVVDDVEGLGEACAEGIGACAVDGIRVCDLDAGAVVCDATPGAPADEICDAIDNDCNGIVDDAPGTGEDCVAGQGACQSAGARVCDADAGAVVCGAVPGGAGPEICDGVDNDCDGIVDNVAGLGDRCSAGVGVCQRDGVQVCDLDAGQLACDAVPGAPAAETCDGLDNDCDGVADDVAGLGDRCSAGVGACARDGARVCDLGSGQLICDTVPGAPAAETCDGLDNDCNGATDDVAGVGDSCSAGIGACQRDGSRVCDAGGGQLVCDATPGAPGVEICDGADNDCNGSVDDVAGLGAACTAGVGSCQRDGSRVCDVGRGQLVCDANPGAPGVEICDGADNDCNGSVDDVAGAGAACSAGVGACQRAGSRVCDVGTGQLVCDARPGAPGAEICDGIDNDCNGAIDSVLGLGAPCSAGLGICRRDGLQICDIPRRQIACAAQPGPAQAETCDNRDEDCDGRTDEGVTRACYGGPGGTQGVGTCRAGTQSCNGGGFGPCQGAITPAPEFCSGQDNDCDGVVDNIAVRTVDSAYRLGLPCFDIDVGDINGDGRLDVICANIAFPAAVDTRLAYWLGNGDGTFGATRHTAALGLPNERGHSDVELADLDRDGDLDVVAVGETMMPQVYLNHRGVLAAPFSAFDFLRPDGTPGTSGLALADFTGDGIIDIATAGGGFRTANYTLMVGRGNGDGTFAAPVEYGASSKLADLVAGDVDGDGDLDLVAWAPPGLVLHRAVGGGFGAGEPLFQVSGFGYELAFADMTGDGRPDLAVPGDGEWLFAQAQGAGFAAPRRTDAAGLMHSAAVGEFDCSPDADLALVSWLGFSPRIEPQPPLQLNAYLAAEYGAYDIEIADLDGDGLDDFVLADRNDGIVVLIQRP